MRIIAIVSAVLASVGAVKAAIEYKDGKYICPKDLPNGAFCAGASLETDIIIRCVNGTGQPGRCSNNLAGQPPIGIIVPARCWELRPDSGIAACEKNCIVYGSSGTVEGNLVLNPPVCSPLYPPLPWPSSSTSKPSHTTPEPSHTSKPPHTTPKPSHTSKPPHTKTDHKTKTKTDHYTKTKTDHYTKTKTDYYTKNKTDHHTDTYTKTKTYHSWHSYPSKPPHTWTKHWNTTHTHAYTKTKTYPHHHSYPTGSYKHKTKTTTTTTEHETTTKTVGPPPTYTPSPPTTPVTPLPPVTTAGAFSNFRAGGSSAAMVVGLGMLVVFFL